jgi:hypothetical protein
LRASSRVEEFQVSPKGTLTSSGAMLNDSFLVAFL